MGINDLPQVDGASMNDDRAKNRLLSRFSRYAGFISREQTQDFGVDFKVELVAQGATNWSFDIQLKSVENPKFIFDGQYLSFSIETSRLNYLLRNEPIYGLLVIYDLGSDRFFFDYVDRLYRRLLEERDGRKWEDNKTVSIRIPTGNILEPKAMAGIHSNFLQRFQNLREMNSDHGANYGLPQIGVGQIKGAELVSVDDAVAELREKGAVLLGQRDLRRVYELLETLPSNQIVSDREVLLVAAFAYSGAGRLADSMYYIERLSRKYTLDEGEKWSIAYISLKNRLGSGEIDRQTFISGAKLLLPSAGAPEQLSLRINILYFELAIIQGFERICPKLVSEYEELQEMILKVRDERQRNYLKASNLDNLAIIVSHERSEGMNRKAVFDQLGMEMDVGQRQKYADKGVTLHQWLNDGYLEVGRYAIKNNEFILLALVTVSSLKFWLEFQMGVVVFGEKGISREKAKLELDERIDIAIETANMLEAHKFLRQAYALRCLASELIFVSREWYGFIDRFNWDEIKSRMQRLEVELELPVFISQMQALIAMKRSGNHHGFAGVGRIAMMSDVQLRTYARYIFESQRHPNGKLENILHEMHVFRTFHQRNIDNRLELHTMRPFDPNLAYTFPHPFYIKDNKTGLQSLSSTDIEVLLQSFGK